MTDGRPAQQTGDVHPARALAPVLAATLLLAAACGEGTPSSPTPTPAASGRVEPEPALPDAAGVAHDEEQTEYRPGRTAYVRVPDDPSAVVVLVPGGSWRTADPTGFRVLAADLAAGRLATVTITYGTDSTGDHHPVPAQDLACAVAFAADRVPGVPVVLAGHSAGAHLALLVGLRPEPGGDCDHPVRAADGVVGLAGPYAITESGTVGENLFGVPHAVDPGLWADGDPTAWVDERPDLPVLLLHGEADDVVPPSATQDAVDALTAAGHDVAHRTYPDVDHIEIIRPGVAAPDVVAWVTGLEGLEDS